MCPGGRPGLQNQWQAVQSRLRWVRLPCLPASEAYETKGTPPPRPPIALYDLVHEWYESYLALHSPRSILIRGVCVSPPGMPAAGRGIDPLSLNVFSGETQSPSTVFPPPREFQNAMSQLIRRFRVHTWARIARRGDGRGIACQRCTALLRRCPRGRPHDSPRAAASRSTRGAARRDAQLHRTAVQRDRGGDSVYQPRNHQPQSHLGRSAHLDPGGGSAAAAPDAPAYPAPSSTPHRRRPRR